MNHNEIVRRWVVKSIATCKHIPLDRDKRAHKVDGYMKTEMEREKNPDQVAQTIQDLQEQVQHLHQELEEEKKKYPRLIRKIWW